MCINSSIIRYIKKTSRLKRYYGRKKKNKEIKQDNNYLNLRNFFSHKMSGNILQNLGRKSKTFEDIKTNKQK